MGGEAPVRQLQIDLRGLGFWPNAAPLESGSDKFTAQAVKLYQRERGFESVDGMAGASLLAAMRCEIAELQSALARAGKNYASGPQTHYFNEPLAGAIERFQKDNRLHASRIFDEATRKALRGAPASPFSFDDQLREELSVIRFLRDSRDQSGETKHSEMTPLAAAHETRLLGLAFSGGGIRSATFNLGVVQGLAKERLLKDVDYLSTVSGGGYVGGWVSAWISRLGADAKAFEDKLACAPEQPLDAGQPDRHEPREIEWLRRYSNYITPRTGVLGLDFLQAVVTWTRNVLINQYVLFAFLCFLLLIPWVLATWLSPYFPSGGLPVDRGLPSIIANIGIFFGGVATFILAFRSFRLSFGDEGVWSKSEIGALVAAFYSLSAFFFGAAVLMVPLSEVLTLTRRAALTYLLSAIVGWSLSSARSEKSGDGADRRRAHLASLRGVLSAAFVFGAAIYAIAAFFGETPVEQKLVHAAVLGAPAASAAILLALTAHLGFAGRGLGEPLREWWSRMGAKIVQLNVFWLALGVAALYGPYAVLWAGNWAAAGGLAWLVATAGGAFAGASVRTEDRKSVNWLDVFARFAPYLFCIGLMVAISFGVFRAIEAWLPPNGTRECSLVTSPAEPSAAQASQSGAPATISGEAPKQYCAFSAYAARLRGMFGQLHDIAPKNPAPSALNSEMREAPSDPAIEWLWVHIKWLWVLAFFGSAFLLARYADINVFSLHMFYRNRLERCYLGASHKDRKEDDFTGLDSRDSPRLANLLQRPFPIINTALNITQTGNLAWQERKGASFTFTPLFCGFQFNNVKGDEEPAFQTTREYAANEKSKAWISLIMPMTISGAAASPNWGYHTNPATSFLMTMFNVRLGWWIQNPRKSMAWRSAGPKWASQWLLKELVGSTTSEKHFVYVSDGGHFENLGLYELVRRRCRYVIVCDAGCDPLFQFEDLGNAIRKIRIDMGIPIEIDARTLQPASDTGESQLHCAMGKIHYQCVDKDAQPGYLLYIKPTLCGQEPADVRQYHVAHPCFPHETTTDQWFGESQFESYRQLGEHIAKRVLENSTLYIRKGAPVTRDTKYDLEELFRSLSERWFPPSVTRSAFSRHGDTISKIFERLRTDPHLRFLDAQFYPEWPHLTEKASEAPRAEMMLPNSYREVRAGFYLCNQLFQLMENIYHDLNMEAEYDHPDNRGWMNLFRHWSWSGMFRIAWAVSSSTFGSRFQTFCRERLGLRDICQLECADYGLDDRLLALESEEGLAPGALINFLERSYIRALRDNYLSIGGSVAALRVIPLRLGVSDPMARPRADTPQGESPEPQFKFTFGVALIENASSEKPLLLYFRIQDHLRGIGLGTRALRELKNKYPQLALREPDCSFEGAPSKVERERLRRLAASVGIKVAGDADPSATDPQRADGAATGNCLSA